MQATREWIYNLASAQGQLEAHETTDIFETIETIGPSTSSNDPTGIPRVSFYGSPNVTRLRNVTVTKTAFRTKSAVMSSLLANELKHSSNSSLPKQPTCYLIDYDCAFFWSSWLGEERAARRERAFVGPTDDFIPSPCHNRTFWATNSTNPCNLHIDACLNHKHVRHCNLITGGEVLLLYFPPESNVNDTASGKTGRKLRRRDVPGIPHRLENGTSGIFSTTALTFRGQDLYHRARITSGETYYLPRTFVPDSTMYGNWTFTSPFLVNPLRYP
jgi:hypothetical protein